jgi:GH15 family glucan-1,4-alpha-glucosidase
VRPRRHDGFLPIEDYAVLGDGRTVALVGMDGSVDWWPVPTIHAPPICAAILDPSRGGRFSLSPVGAYEAERAYVPHTNVLETTYRTASGVVRVTEALNSGMSGRLPWTELARRVDGLEGKVAMQWRLAPGDRFGDARPWASWQAEVPVIVVQDQSLALLVHGAEPGTVSAHDVSGEALISEGDRLLVTMVATDHEPLSLPTQQSIERRLDHSCRSWREWSDGIEYDGTWRADVVRSALALKTLFYEPGGAIAAAATTSLPEARGGHKNWDYRYSWVRDSSFTIDAFISLGLHEEVHASVSWILAALREHGPELRVFYTLDGDVPDQQRELAARGYRDSRPVRAGNRAATQLQLGNFGDLFDTVARYAAAGHLLDQGTAQSLADLADQCCDRWTAKDSGIWELESLEHYTISKIGCWVALDRAAALASNGQLPRERAQRWASEAAEVRRWVNKRCWSDERQTYTMYAGSRELDAAVLLAGRTGFDRGERLAGTIEAVQRELGVGESPLLFRYSGMQDEEGAFVACSFWMVHALASTHQVKRAVAVMDRSVALASDLGLLSEQIDADDGTFLGNFPQALSHLALVNAACALADAAPSES